MKKTISITLLLMLSFFSAQKTKFYTFDKEIIYTFEALAKKTDTSIFINSDDDSYFLRVYSGIAGSTAKIFDWKNKQIHIFNLNKNPKKGENYYDFHFNKTTNLSASSTIKKEKISIEDLSNENNKKIVIYTSKHKKRIDREVTFSTLTYDKNLFFAFRFIALHPYEQATNIDINDKAIVEKAIVKNGKLLCNYKLKTINPVSLDLKTN